MKALLWVLGIVVILVGLFFALNSYIYNEKQRPNPAPVEVQEEGRYMDIETYVKTSISTLSPIKEQLGGTFYVTSIEAHDGTGTVEYEDGHSAYTADFTYEVGELGEPSVTSFTIRAQ